MARVLNAEAVQKAFKSRSKAQPADNENGKLGGGGTKNVAGKKRKRGNDEGDAATKNGDKELKIKPGESLAHFRRCVPTLLRQRV